MVHGTVVIDAERCKSCELCASVCPRNLLRIDHTRFNARGYRPIELIDPDGSCTGCGLCAMICPDVVLTVYRCEPQHIAA